MVPQVVRVFLQTVDTSQAGARHKGHMKDRMAAGIRMEATWLMVVSVVGVVALSSIRVAVVGTKVVMLEDTTQIHAREVGHVGLMEVVHIFRITPLNHTAL
jgi:hypothetical protein